MRAPRSRAVGSPLQLSKPPLCPRHIVKAIGAGTSSTAAPGSDRPCTFIVQEACDAGTLRRVVTEQPLLSKRKRYSDLQACNGHSPRTAVCWWPAG